VKNYLLSKWHHVEPPIFVELSRVGVNFVEEVEQICVVQGLRDEDGIRVGHNDEHRTNIFKARQHFCGAGSEWHGA